MPDEENHKKYNEYFRLYKSIYNHLKEDMKDLTKGTPARVMIQFAVPVALGNMFQLCYSLADTRVVGSALGETALAAVGATASISTLFIGFLSGLTNGFSLLIAREFGAGNEEGVKRFAAGACSLEL
mgnify:CR=1 FL=1